MSGQRIALFVIAGLMIAGCVVTALAPMDRAASFEAVAQVFADAFRDVDQAGLQLTRVSIRDENELGTRLGEAMEKSYPMPGDLSRYVSEIGNRLAIDANRKGIFYRFRVLDSPTVNAFSLPGGYIFVYKGLIDKLDNEAQLAAVLGHEIAHVDLMHCIERYQYQLKLKQLKLPSEIGELADMARAIGVQAYSQQQELDADSHGWDLAVKAGYDPDGARAVMALFDQLATGGVAPSPRLPNSPVQEAAGALDQSLQDFFRSHPRNARRAQQLRELVAKRQSELSGRSFFLGKKNLRDRVTCLQRPSTDEIVKFP